MGNGRLTSPRAAVRRPDGTPVWYGISAIRDTNSVRRYEEWATTERPKSEPHFVIRVVSRYGSLGGNSVWANSASAAVEQIAGLEQNQRRANPPLCDAYRRLRERIMREWDVVFGTSADGLEQSRREADRAAAMRGGLEP